jgi:hypothetical protein
MICPERHARVVQEQDSAVSPAQMAVRVRPPRSIPKGLVVEPVMPSAVREIITSFHYLHSMPAASRRCYGVFHDSTLSGAVVFTAGARRGHHLLAAAQPQEVATLARLWLSDELPKNAESRVIGIVLRHLRRHTGWKLLLSYADPSAGHVGTIYQATGWLYLGQGCAEGYLELGDGQILHPRTAYKRFGSTAIGHLTRTGVPAQRRRTHPKHRYAYLLDSAWRWRLREAGQPYPKPSLAEGRP